MADLADQESSSLVIQEPHKKQLAEQLQLPAEIQFIHLHHLELLSLHLRKQLAERFHLMEHIGITHFYLRAHSLQPQQSLQTF
jgi:hypothetical protein